MPNHIDQVVTVPTDRLQILVGQFTPGRSQLDLESSPRAIGRVQTHVLAPQIFVSPAGCVVAPYDLCQPITGTTTLIKY